jgi:hypothetical protein
MQKMIWTTRESILTLLVHSTMHLPFKMSYKFIFPVFSEKLLYVAMWLKCLRAEGMVLKRSLLCP